MLLGDGDDDAGAEGDETGGAEERASGGGRAGAGVAHEDHAGEEEDYGGDVVHGMVLRGVGKIGGDSGARTRNLGIANAALSQIELYPHRGGSLQALSVNYMGWWGCSPARQRGGAGATR